MSHDRASDEESEATEQRVHGSVENRLSFEVSERHIHGPDGAQRDKCS